MFITMMLVQYKWRGLLKMRTATEKRAGRDWKEEEWAFPSSPWLRATLIRYQLSGASRAK